MLILYSRPYCLAFSQSSSFTCWGKSCWLRVFLGRSLNSLLTHLHWVWAVLGPDNITGKLPGRETTAFGNGEPPTYLAGQQDSAASSELIMPPISLFLTSWIGTAPWGWRWGQAPLSALCSVHKSTFSWGVPNMELVLIAPLPGTRCTPNSWYV